MAALRMLVVIEPGRAGDAAVEKARAQATRVESEVTLVGVAPQVGSVRCGPSAGAFDDAVIDAVARDVARARERLASAGVDARYRVLVEGRDPSLEEFAAAGSFGVIIRPWHRSWWRQLRGRSEIAAARE